MILYRVHLFYQQEHPASESRNAYPIFCRNLCLYVFSPQTYQSGCCSHGGWLETSPARFRLLIYDIPHGGRRDRYCVSITHSPQLETTIISDSKWAILNFLYARVSPATLSVLLEAQNIRSRSFTLVWAPAHTALPGNSAAHEAAWALVYRGLDGAANDSEIFTLRDRLHTYGDILAHYRLERAIFPPPHPSLSRSLAVIYRQLQTRSFPTPAIM